MKLTSGILYLFLTHHAASFSTISQLSVAPRALPARTHGIQFARTKPSGTNLKMSSSEATLATEEDPVPLFEGLGKGIVRDWKGRLPLYSSDIKDGLNTQVRTIRKNYLTI